MSSGNIRLDEVEDDEAGERSVIPEDHLATTRLPPLARPLLPPPPLPPPRAPLPSTSPSVVPAATAAVSPTIPPPPLDIGGPLPTMPPPAASTSDAPSEPPAQPAQRDVDPPGAVRTSWWRALLTNTVPPSSGAGALQGVRMRLAVLTAALGLISFVVALVVGFGGPPQDLLMSSTVAASIVIAHAVMGLGLFAVGLGLLRAAERMYFEPPTADAHGRDA
jgi:hypothetical protein